MDREVLFAKTLQKVREKAGKQGNVISEEEVKAAFLELELSEDQFAMIYDFLKKHKIGIGEPVDLQDYLTDEEKDYLQTYLEELEALEELSEGEKEAVALSAMAGDPAARQKLITIYLQDAVDLAKLYAGQGTTLEDLIGEGNLALASGVEMLGCLEHASEVQGMLGKMMMDAMEQMIAKNQASGETGQHIADQVNKVADAAAALSGELLRDVTPEELAAEGNVTVSEIEDALALSGGKIDGLESTGNNNGKS